MVVILTDMKNEYYSKLEYEELKAYHSLLESQLQNLEIKEIKSRINSSVNVLREMSRNRVHLNKDEFVHEDINFLKANGLMYLSEYVRRTKNVYVRRNRRENSTYIRQALLGLVSNCSILDYVNVSSSIIGLEKFVLENPPLRGPVSFRV